ncbi:MAG TPA: NUDIX hydrolase, partial [Methylibium sp.]|nr:NUDIX hydrolase [Methylibium sp.]
MTAPDDPPHLRETCVASETAWRGGFLDVRRDTVRLPDGREAQREYIVHPGAVMIVPLLDDGRVVVERQYRYPLRRTFVEFPAGKIDPGEQPLTCAVRELAEETGYRAAEWARAGILHNAIAYSNEGIEIWFARGLTAGERRLDEGEFLDVLRLSLEEMEDLARQGELTDA